MKPKPKAKTNEQPLIATIRLDVALDMNHELVRLAQTINREAITTELRTMYSPDNGRPAVPTRLMAGLLLARGGSDHRSDAARRSGKPGHVCVSRRSAQRTLPG